MTKRRRLRPRLHPALTPASARVLRWMIEEKEQLVVEGLDVWVGCHRTNHRVVKTLLEQAIIKRDSTSGMSAVYYCVTPDAQKCLDDPDYETRWTEHLRTGKSVHR